MDIINCQNIGLVLDIIGAGMLFISTEKLNRVIVDLLKHYQLNSSGFDRDKIKVEQIKKFDEAKNVSAFFAYLGVGLLIVGFVLQLIAAN